MVNIYNCYFIIVCPDDRYGHRCLELCGYCKGREPCNKVTGHCNAGCSSGYNGTYCKQSKWEVVYCQCLSAIEILSFTMKGIHGPCRSDNKSSLLICIFLLEYCIYMLKGYFICHVPHYIYANNIFSYVFAQPLKSTCVAA